MSLFETRSPARFYSRGSRQSHDVKEILLGRFDRSPGGGLIWVDLLFLPFLNEGLGQLACPSSEVFSKLLARRFHEVTQNGRPKVGESQLALALAETFPFQVCGEVETGSLYTGKQTLKRRSVLITQVQRSVNVLRPLNDSKRRRPRLDPVRLNLVRLSVPLESSRIQCCPPIHHLNRILLEVGRELGCELCYCVVAKQALGTLPDLVHDDCCAGWEIHRFRISHREAAEIGAATFDRDSRRLTSIIVLCDRQPSDSTSDGISTPPALALSSVENAPFATRAFRESLP